MKWLLENDCPPDAVRIQTEDFSVEAEIDGIKQRSAARGKIGATVAFVGTARDFSCGEQVHELYFEHYHAEQRLLEIRAEALRNYAIMDVTIVHRIGTVPAGDNIVLVVVAAGHRSDAFQAAAWCIENLKQTAPIWKKEITPSGASWVTPHP